MKTASMCFEVNFTFEVCYREANAAITLLKQLALSLSLQYFEYIFKRSQSLLTPGQNRA